MKTTLLFLVSDKPFMDTQFDLQEEISQQVNGGIQLNSFEFGLKQQITTEVSNSARTSGRPYISDVTCEKDMDQASILLSDHCLMAKPIGAKCRLLVFQLEGEQLHSRMNYELSDVLVSSYNINSGDGEGTKEIFTLNFTELRQSYFEWTDQKPIEKSSTWSISRNRPI